MKNHTTPPPQPVFIKAHVKIYLDGKDYSFLNQNLSLKGPSNIRWIHSDAKEFIGKDVFVKISVKCKADPFEINTNGLLTVEEAVSTSDDKIMQTIGVNLNLDNNSRAKLARAILTEGFVPSAYFRKYPRIPSMADLKEMPMQAFAWNDKVPPFTCKIGNISPGGIMLLCDNALCTGFKTGSVVKIRIEPRRLTFEPIEFSVLIRRINIEYNKTIGAQTRTFGMSYFDISNKDKKLLLDTLRSVLVEITLKNFTR